MIAKEQNKSATTGKSKIAGGKMTGNPFAETITGSGRTNAIKAFERIDAHIRSAAWNPKAHVSVILDELGKVDAADSLLIMSHFAEEGVTGTKSDGTSPRVKNLARSILEKNITPSGSADYVREKISDGWVSLIEGNATLRQDTAKIIKDDPAGLEGVCSKETADQRVLASNTMAAFSDFKAQQEALKRFRV